MASKPAVVSKQKLPVLLQKKDGVSVSNQNNNTVTEVLKDKASKLVKKSSPAKIAETIGASKSILPGFVGGMKQDDSPAGQSQQKPSLSEVPSASRKSNETLVESLNKLYGMHKKIIALENSDASLKRKKEKQEQRDKVSRHKEILEALESLNISTEYKPKATKSKPKPVQKSDKTIPKKKSGKKKIQKSLIRSFVAEHGAQAVAVAGVTGFGLANKITSTPQPPGTTGAPPAPPVGKPSATQTSVGTSGSTSQSTLLNAMAGAETKGNYDIAYGDRVDKSGKIINIAGVQTAEEFANKKLTEMTLEEVEQFQRSRNSKVKNTGAVGKYQFVGTTLFNKGGLVDQLGLDKKTTLFNSETQDKLALLLLKGNTAIMQAAGVPNTPAYQYMSWYVGPSGAAAVFNAVKNGNGDLTVAEAIKKANLPDPSAQNKELTKIAAKDFEGILSQRMAAHGAPPGQEGQTQVASALQTASQVRVSSKFGLRDHPVTGQKDKMHEGVDLAGKLGDPVHATGEGTVTIPNEDPKGYGKWVIVNHADGVQTYYAHLSEITVKQGQQVQAGTNLGKVGSTGMSTGPHLHYQVMKNGKPVDPANNDIPILSNYAVAMTGTGLAGDATMVSQANPDVASMSVENKQLKESNAQKTPVLINNITTVSAGGSGSSQSYVIQTSKETISRESALMWNQRGYS